MIQLIRKYYKEATHGELMVNNKHIAFTIELPWRANEREISCIPEGTYNIRRRFSKKFSWHWIVENVPERSYILIHPANDAIVELKGCIAPVTSFLGIGKGKSSKLAMQNLLEVFNKYKVNGQLKLIITCDTHNKNF